MSLPPKHSEGRGGRPRCDQPLRLAGASPSSKDSTGLRWPQRRQAAGGGLGCGLGSPGDLHTACRRAHRTPGVRGISPRSRDATRSETRPRNRGSPSTPGATGHAALPSRHQLTPLHVRWGPDRTTLSMTIMSRGRTRGRASSTRRAITVVGALLGVSQKRTTPYSRREVLSCGAEASSMTGQRRQHQAVSTVADQIDRHPRHS